MFGLILVATIIGSVIGLCAASGECSYEKAWKEFCDEYGVK